MEKLHISTVLVIIFTLSGCGTSDATQTPALYTNSAPTITTTPTAIRENIILVPSPIQVTAQPMTSRPEVLATSPIPTATQASDPIPISPAHEAMRDIYEITFQPGHTSAIIEYAVVRGTRDKYMFTANVGQLTSVKISSLEDNAVFSIATPAGEYLAGNAEMQDSMEWSGRLPLTGDYIITVGGTRGNATYRLELSIEP